MQEVWKDVENYSRYKINNLGIILDCKTNKELQPTLNGGFLCLNMFRNDGIRRLNKIHHLVAEAFILNPYNYGKVGHYNNDRTDNSSDNIYWKEFLPKPYVVGLSAPTILFKGKQYRYDAFAALCKISKDVMENRIKDLGWTPEECFRGARDFKEPGYTTSTHWFPYKYQRDEHLVKERKQRLEYQRRLTAEAKANKPAYKKYGVGVFVNTPVVGIIGRKATKTYQIWDGMLSRCYNIVNDHYPMYGAKGTTVCVEWHEFQPFAVWYEAQYKEEGWHLDKDILSQNNVKIYSPTTCVVVPPSVNAFFSVYTRIKSPSARALELYNKYHTVLDDRVNTELLNIINKI